MLKTVCDVLEQDNGYVQYLADRLLKTLVHSVNDSSKIAYQICSGFEQNFKHIMEAQGFDFPQKKRGKDKLAYSPLLSSGVVEPVDWETIKAFTEMLGEDEVPAEDIFSQNVRQLKAHIGLSDIEVDVLIYIQATNEMEPEYRNFVEGMIRTAPERFSAFITLAMGRQNQFTEVSKAIRPHGKLASFGLITYENANLEDRAIPEIDPDLRIALSEREFDFQKTTENLIGKPVKAALTIDKNFPHLRKKALQIAKVLKGAMAQNRQGVNVVLYGPAGSGKTELAKAIAEEAGLPAFAVGEDERSNTQHNLNVSSTRRLSRLLQAQLFLRHGVTITDEMEDLLGKGPGANGITHNGSKILSNRALEENGIPGIFIGNDINEFHPSFRQRFKLTLFVDYQPTLVRQDIWAFHIEKNGLSIDKSDILALARAYEAPPRVIADACEVAALSGGGVEILRDQVEDKAALEYQGDRSGYSVSVPVPGDYDLELLESESDLDAVVQAFKAACEKEYPSCFLIDGKQNVGKSTLASYFAEQSMRHTTFFDMEHLLRPTAQSEPVDNVSIVFNHVAKSDAILVLENINLLFNFAAKEDKIKIIKRFMKHLGEHKAPVILINEGVPKNIPDSFSVFMDHRVPLRKIGGGKLEKAAQKLLGRSLDGTQPVAIGNLSFAAHSLTGGPGIDEDTIHKRIAASAVLSSPETGGKFTP